MNKCGICGEQLTDYLQTVPTHRTCAQAARDQEKRIDAMVANIRELREFVWNQDIPHPTVPEYVEHHEQIQAILMFIDDKLLKGV